MKRIDSILKAMGSLIFYLRKLLFRGKLSDIDHVIPYDTAEMLYRGRPIKTEKQFAIVRDYRILRTSNLLRVPDLKYQDGVIFFPVGIDTRNFEQKIKEQLRAYIIAVSTFHPRTTLRPTYLEHGHELKPTGYREVYTLFSIGQYARGELFVEKRWKSKPGWKPKHITFGEYNSSSMTVVIEGLSIHHLIRFCKIVSYTFNIKGVILKAPEPDLESFFFIGDFLGTYDW